MSIFEVPHNPHLRDTPGVRGRLESYLRWDVDKLPEVMVEFYCLAHLAERRPMGEVEEIATKFVKGLEKHDLEESVGEFLQNEYRNSSARFISERSCRTIVLWIALEGDKELLDLFSDLLPPKFELSYEENSEGEEVVGVRDLNRKFTGWETLLPKKESPHPPPQEESTPTLQG